VIEAILQKNSGIFYRKQLCTICHFNIFISAKIKLSQLREK